MIQHVIIRNRNSPQLPFQFCTTFRDNVLLILSLVDQKMINLTIQLRNKITPRWKRLFHVKYNVRDSFANHMKIRCNYSNIQFKVAHVRSQIFQYFLFFEEKSFYKLYVLQTRYKYYI